MIKINREVAKCSNTSLKNLRAKDLRDGGLIEAVERKCPPIPERHHLAMSLEGSQCLAIVPSQNVPLAPYNIDNHFLHRLHAFGHGHSRQKASQMRLLQVHPAW
jgi:hypothetical protein